MSIITEADMTRLKGLASRIKREQAKLERAIDKARGEAAEAEQPFQAEIRRLQTTLFDLEEKAADASQAARDKVAELTAQRKDAGVDWLAIATGLSTLDEHGLAALDANEQRMYDGARQTWRAARAEYRRRGPVVPDEIRVEMAGGARKPVKFHCQIRAAKLGDLASAEASTPEAALTAALEGSATEFWRRYELGH